MNQAVEDARPAGERPGGASVSIVIPAYNEARRLPRSLPALDSFLRALDRPVEVVVVDNGSTDGTATALAAYTADMPYLRVISISTRGKGIAVRTGVFAARHEYLLVCDADFSMPPGDLGVFLDELERGSPIVIGSREGPQATRIDEPELTHIRGRVFNAVVKLLAVGGLQDTQCGFKAFRREAARRLFALARIDGWAFDVEILYLARKMGYPIREVGIRWRFDPDTRVRGGSATMEMLEEVLRVRWNDLLGRYVTPAEAGVRDGREHHKAGKGRR
jgi:glycosyltransferase involved in cell wall biosynthesis